MRVLSFIWCIWYPTHRCPLQSFTWLHLQTIKFNFMRWKPRQIIEFEKVANLLVKIQTKKLTMKKMYEISTSDSSWFIGNFRNQVTRKFPIWHWRFVMIYCVHFFSDKIYTTVYTFFIFNLHHSVHFFHIEFNLKFTLSAALKG